ncbi:MAG: tellurite resistance/C4-dicarboxylate transporter family protein [Actinomycetaceae bacterium]
MATSSSDSPQDSRLRTLSPSSFALVMATGIVSLGLSDVGLALPSLVLLVLGAGAYVVLAVLYTARWVRHRDAVRADMRDPSVAFGYFTIVAGTGVLAVGALGQGAGPVAVALLVVAAVVWLVLGYVLPWQVVMAREGESILPRVNGTWFIWCVASQSVAVGLSSLRDVPSAWGAVVGFLAVLTWSVGALLYAGIAVLVILRLVHFGMRPEQFEPPYWVAMGALAISVVAGAGIVDMPPTPMVDAARGLVAGTVVIFWCCAAWIIPMLVGAGLWRHVVHRVPLIYTPMLWSIVFPLGMFAHASIRLGRVESVPLVEGVGRGFLWLAVAAWLLVAASLVVDLARGRNAAARAARP